MLYLSHSFNICSKIIRLPMSNIIKGHLYFEEASKKIEKNEKKRSK